MEYFIKYRSKLISNLIGVPCLKLSCSIIYSGNLSHGLGPWGHSLYALVFAVTCMEQLNAHKLSANQGKAMKGILLFFAAIPRCTTSCHSQLFTLSPRFLVLSLFQLNPPVNLMHDWEGTMSAWRGRRGEDGKEMDTPLVSLLSFTGLSV